MRLKGCELKHHATHIYIHTHTHTPNTPTHTHQTHTHIKQEAHEEEEGAINMTSNDVVQNNTFRRQFFRFMNWKWKCTAGDTHCLLHTSNYTHGVRADTEVTYV